MSAPLLSVHGDQFHLGGRPHQIVSGGIHYFRIHPALWTDRLRRVRALGVNTVETYVPWNVHERVRGQVDFQGAQDLARFVRLAGELDLDVILRPGPYICAEWDFGGLPGWLMSEPGMQLRCAEPRFLAAVDAWFDAVTAVMRPLLRTRGGPVVAIQIENEYGSYGDDQAYLEHCHQALLEGGMDVLLLTSDGPDSDYQASGSLPGVLATANFGSRPADAFGALRAAMPRGPLMCMEYWNGWFDHWGEQHHRREPRDAAEVLEEMLASGASVNLYMAHGGTNFGLWNGANLTDGIYEPTVTSYDYDAPIAEGGELTAKFHAFRRVIGQYLPLPEDPLPAPPRRLPPTTVQVSGWTSLLASLDAFDAVARSAAMPLSLEQLGLDHGLVVYRSEVLVPSAGGELVVDGLADRALVLLDGVVVGILSRNDPRTAVQLPPRPAQGRARLELVVENQGRINYGPSLGERKGIASARLNQRLIHDWTCTALRLDDRQLTTRLAFDVPAPHAPNPHGGPVFAQARVTVDEPADGFVALPGWGKGFVWLNGFLLGRYWAIGPQLTLYAPWPLWHRGENTLVVLELESAGTLIEIRAEPLVG